MPKTLLAATLSLIAILALTAALTTTNRAEPALTRSTSLLPPPPNTCST